VNHTPIAGVVPVGSEEETAPTLPNSSGEIRDATTEIEEGIVRFPPKESFEGET
jgi:hypothetical protein